MSVDLSLLLDYPEDEHEKSSRTPSSAPQNWPIRTVVILESSSILSQDAMAVWKPNAQRCSNEIEINKDPALSNGTNFRPRWNDNDCKVFNPTTCPVEPKSRFAKIKLPSYSKRLCVLVLTLILTIALVAITFTAEVQMERSESFSDEVFNVKTTADEQMNKQDRLIVKKNSSTYEIQSLEGLIKIEYASTIIISSLVDEFYPIHGLNPKYFPTVTQLKIVGAVSEDWLEYLFQIFPNVRNLSLDIDKLCIGSTVEDRKTLSALTLQNVQVLEIVNSNICLLANWVYSWDIPSLRELIITNSDINKQNCKPLKDFLRKESTTVKTVAILNCRICEECVIPQLDIFIPQKHSV